jgi:hypothetical protein
MELGKAAGVAHLPGSTDQEDTDPRLLGYLAGAGNDLGGSPITTHGVDRHRKARKRLTRRADATSGHYSTSIAWRPLYQPQFGHTTWGSLALVHCGHTERAGAFSTQLDARRLRLFALEVFFLGTAIGRAF